MHKAGGRGPECTSPKRLDTKDHVVDTQCSLSVSALGFSDYIKKGDSFGVGCLSVSQEPLTPYKGFLNPQARAETAAQPRLKMPLGTEDNKPGANGQGSSGVIEAERLMPGAFLNALSCQIKVRFLIEQSWYSKLHFVWLFIAQP